MGKLLLIFCVVLVFGACREEGADSEPAAAPASPPQVSGTYTGLFSGSIGSGTLTLTVSQNGNSVSGNFLLGSSGGSFTGTLEQISSAMAFVITAIPDDGSCSLRLIGGFSAGAATGNIQTVSCSPFRSGTYNLARQ